MNRFFPLAVAFGLACFHAASAEDLTTTKGTVYKGVFVSKVEPDGLRIVHAGGAAKVSFEVLSPEVQKKYGYNPAKGEAFAKAEEEKNKALVKEQAARARAEEIAAKKAAAVKAEAEKKEAEQSKSGSAADSTAKDSPLKGATLKPAKL